MLTLGAMVITLAFLAGVVDQLSLPENLPVTQFPEDAGNVLPVDTVKAPFPLPLNSPLAKPSGPRPQPPIKCPAEGARDNCPIMATYRLSAEKLEEYLNSSLPAKIEELVKCSDVNLAGLLGSLLNTLCGTNFLDAASGLTNILPLSVLNGVLGKNTDSKAPSPAGGSDPAAIPVPPIVLDDLPVPVPGAEPVQAVANPVSKITWDMVTKAKSLPGLTDDLLKGVALGKVSAVSDMVQNLHSTSLLSDLLSSVGSGSASGSLDVSRLLLNTKLGDVTVNSITYSMTDKGMDAQASVTAGVIAEGAAGAVVTLLGFQVSLEVTVHIAGSSSTHEPVNNTCQLEVEQKSIEATEVCITLVEKVLDTLPLPLPLPLSLDDVVLMALSLDLTENAKESSCAIQLDDFDTGKNETGAVCQYTITKTEISADGLCISYCVQDVEASIIDLFFTYPSPTTVRVTFKFALQRAGQPYGTTNAVALYTRNCRTENGKFVAEVTYSSANQEPPEIMNEMPDLMSAVLPKVDSAITGCVSTWNLPPGISSYPVPSRKIIILKSKDLYVGK